MLTVDMIQSNWLSPSCPDTPINEDCTQFLEDAPSNTSATELNDSGSSPTTGSENSQEIWEGDPLWTYDGVIDSEDDSPDDADLVGSDSQDSGEFLDLTNVDNDVEAMILEAEAGGSMVFEGIAEGVSDDLSGDEYDPTSDWTPGSEASDMIDEWVEDDAYGWANTDGYIGVDNLGFYQASEHHSFDCCESESAWTDDDAYGGSVDSPLPESVEIRHSPTVDDAYGGSSNAPVPAQRPMRRLPEEHSSAWWGGGLNPGNWVRWLYTGDANASDATYYAALNDAGQYYLHHAGESHQAVENIARADPTFLAAGTAGVLRVVEGEDLHNAVMANAEPAPQQINIAPGLHVPANALPEAMVPNNGAAPLPPAPPQGPNPPAAPAAQDITKFVRDWGPAILYGAMVFERLAGGDFDDEAPTGVGDGGFFQDDIWDLEQQGVDDWWNDADNVADFAREINELNEQARGFGESLIPAITPPHDRNELRDAMGEPPVGMDNPNAHHDLPWTFREWFAGEGRGLNVNDPEFGRWVEGTPPGQHQNWTPAFEQEWRDFIESNRDATRDEVIDFMNQLRQNPAFH